MELAFWLVPLQKQIEANWEYWSSFQLPATVSPRFIFLTNCSHFPRSLKAAVCGIYFWPSCIFGKESKLISVVLYLMLNFFCFPISTQFCIKQTHLALGGFPGGTSGKEPASQFRRLKRHRLDPHWSDLEQHSTSGSNKTYFPLNTTVWKYFRNIGKPEAGYFIFIVVDPLSYVQLFVTLCTVAYQSPLSMEFSRQV